MKYYDEIVKDFEVTEKDIKNIQLLKTKILKYKDECMEFSIEYLNDKHNFIDTNPENIANFKDFLVDWLEMFLSCDFNNDYISMLESASKTHLKYKIEQDHVNALLSFIRRFLHEKIFQNFQNNVERKDLLLSFHKFLDINFYILNKAFLEEKLKKSSLEFGLRNYIIRIGDKFSFVMQIVLITILIILTSIATIILSKDFADLVMDGTHQLLITSLGSLLIIWVLAELIKTELHLIKGGEFRLSIFIGVALIAYIRDLLILTLQNNAFTQATLYVLLAILILGFIYWLIYKTERTEMLRRKI
jgi:uncharacterized membrane protein (DUF373 family)